MAPLNRPTKRAAAAATTSNGTYEEKPKYSRRRSSRTSAKTVVVVVLFLVTLIPSCLYYQRRQHYYYDGPPRDLVVRAKRTFFHKVPDSVRRHFFVDDDNKFRRTMIRAFRNRGWKKSNTPEGAQFIWDKSAWSKRYSILQPWQRYNHIPNYAAWEHKDRFVSGFREYYEQYPHEPNFLPETYRLNREGRKLFKKRLYEQGGIREPWVLKDPDENNGRGITMLGPNSDQLHGVLEKARQQAHSQHDKNDYIIQQYICNELTWFQHEKFDLRFYWMVASLDPLVVLYHDGYVRVGNSAYDENDWTSTRQHLTTHTFLADEVKGTMPELKERLWQHYHDHKSTLTHVRDPVRHVRNQFKAAIAQTAAAFRDVTFGNDRNHRLSSENGYGFFGCDFVLDCDLQVWYVEAQMGPGLEEEYDFRVEMHADLLRSMVDIAEEIQLKQETDPGANVLPIESLGGWEVVYAGDWQYRYEGYERVKMQKCGQEK